MCAQHSSSRLLSRLYRLKVHKREFHKTLCKVKCTFNIEVGAQR